MKSIPPNVGGYAIGHFRIDPDRIKYDGVYITQFPKGGEVLSIGWVDDGITLWVAVPSNRDGELTSAYVRRTMYIIPGSTDHPFSALQGGAEYLGSVMVAFDSTPQDWHVFIELGDCAPAMLAPEPGALVLH